MAVMAASVHFSWVLASVWKFVELLHGQGVHIGAQANGAVACAVFDDAHHTRRTHATVHGNTPLRQLGGDQICRMHFSKAKLRVGVNLFANRGNASGLGGNGINDFHNFSLL
jgi:hypothetical protein